MENKIKIYFKNKKEVIAVYLFGSHAKGKEHVSSDIDIGILLDNHKQIYDRELLKKYIIELGRILRKDIHPVIMNLASEELLIQIFLTGQCLVVNKPAKLARHRMIMFSKIAEFAYYRNQMQLGLIRKIMQE